MCHRPWTLAGGGHTSLMRTWLVCAVLITVTAVASFTLGLRQRVSMPEAVTTPEIMIWHMDCGTTPEPGEALEKL